MKKKTVFFALIMLIAIPVSAVADEDISTDAILAERSTENVGPHISVSDFNLSLGIKIWHINQKFKSSSDYGETESFDGFLYGPSFLLIYKNKFFTEIKYLTGGAKDDYYDEAMEKSDFDIWVGYSIHPRGSVFWGYKNIKNDIDSEEYGEMNFNGPAVGLDLNYPLGDSGFILLGTFEYGYLKGETKVDDYDPMWVEWENTSEKVNGFSIEIGASYIFQSPLQLSMNVALKWQSFKGDKLESKNDGLTFGINYYF